MASVDGRGRLADRVVFGALGWMPGTRVAVERHAGLLLAGPRPDGAGRMTHRGHLHLPAAVRQRCRIQAGDRLLMVAEQGDGVLVIYPPTSLQAMVTAFHAFQLGGEDA